MTIWPEDPVHAGYGDPREVQTALDAGDESHGWRTDPRQVAERFAREFLGWNEVTLDGVETTVDDGSNPPHTTFAIAACPPDVTCDAIWQAVILVQPARLGDGGIWSVAAIEGLSNGRLDFGLRWNEPPAMLKGRSEVSIQGDHARTTLGYVLSDGCRILSGADSDLSAEAGVGITLPDALPPGQRTEAASIPRSDMSTHGRVNSPTSRSICATLIRSRTQAGTRW